MRLSPTKELYCPRPPFFSPISPPPPPSLSCHIRPFLPGHFVRCRAISWPQFLRGLRLKLKPCPKETIFHNKPIWRVDYKVLSSSTLILWFCSLLPRCVGKTMTNTITQIQNTVCQKTDDKARRIFTPPTSWQFHTPASYYASDLHRVWNGQCLSCTRS